MEEALYSGVRRAEISVDIIEELEETGVSRLPGGLIDLVRPNEFILLDCGERQRPVICRHTVEGVILPHKLPDSNLAARNMEQALAQDLLHNRDIPLVTMAGPAGTGKTLLAVAAGLQQVESGKYQRLVITRPIAPMGKDLGYLPGTMEEKMSPWIAPIRDNMAHLLGRSRKGRSRPPSAVQRDLDIMFQKGIIEVEALAYIRGRSLPGMYLIVDEAQNLDIASLKTILTRAGDGTKIVLTGDLEQVDNRIQTGLGHVIEKFSSTELAGHLTLWKGERSPLATLASKIL